MVTSVITPRFRLRFLVFPFVLFFDAHVLEFARLEDLAALKTLHEFRVFVTAHDGDARVFASLLVSALTMRERL